MLVFNEIEENFLELVGIHKIHLDFFDKENKGCKLFYNGIEIKPKVLDDSFQRIVTFESINGTSLSLISEYDKDDKHEMKRVIKVVRGDTQIAFIRDLDNSRDALYVNSSSNETYDEDSCCLSTMLFGNELQTSIYDQTSEGTHIINSDFDKVLTNSDRFYNNIMTIDYNPKKCNFYKQADYEFLLETDVNMIQDEKIRDIFLRFVPLFSTDVPLDLIVRKIKEKKTVGEDCFPLYSAYYSIEEFAHRTTRKR